MKLLIYSLSALAIFVVQAGAEPVEERQALMKERGDIMRVLGPIAQEKQPFDAATVNEALQRLQANAETGTNTGELWPEGSNTGESESTPAVWEDRDGFQAAADKMAADATAAVEANPQDLASFQAAFGTVANNCGSCHETYRLKN